MAAAPVSANPWSRSVASTCWRCCSAARLRLRGAAGTTPRPSTTSATASGSRRIPLYQHAIALDPRFSAAYLRTWRWSTATCTDDLAAAAITQAYALRAAAPASGSNWRPPRATTPSLQATFLEGLRIWSRVDRALPERRLGLGQPRQQGDLDRPVRLWRSRTDAGALALGAESETNYVVLARALLRAGQLNEAQAVCAQAGARHVDGDDLHGLLYDIAVARGDDAAATAQLQWADAKPGERTLLIAAGQEAYARGEVRRGLDLFGRAETRGQSFGLGDIFSAPNARLLFDLGRPDLAYRALSQVPAGYDSADYRFALSEFGDTRRADALLAADAKKTPANTLLTQVFAAEQHAAADLRRGQPSAAIDALRRPRPTKCARWISLTCAARPTWPRRTAPTRQRSSGRYWAIQASNRFPGAQSASPTRPGEGAAARGQVQRQRQRRRRRRQPARLRSVLPGLARRRPSRHAVAHSRPSGIRRGCRRRHVGFEIFCAALMVCGRAEGQTRRMLQASLRRSPCQTQATLRNCCWGKRLR